MTSIQFNPLYAWLLIGFGCVFFFLGVFIMAPWAIQGSAAGGVGARKERSGFDGA
jgi:hypothetical protein